MVESARSQLLASAIRSIEVATLQGERPRVAGSNARLDEHGKDVRSTLARVTTVDGHSGFGQIRATRDQLEPLLELPLSDAFGDDGLIGSRWAPLEHALWDLLGTIANLPVYRILADALEKDVIGQVAPPCYDTSLYIDDLKANGEDAAAELIASEAMEGYGRGHRAFKIKIGRGARHLPLEIGTRRDIAVIRAVREAVGADCVVMVDANNGYNLNLTKRVLYETRDCKLHWMEEAFNEDNVLYADLKAWLKSEGIATLIADGEGYAAPALMTWAQQGLVDVVQYDIIDKGLSGWVKTSQQLDAWGAQTGPHIYGGFYGVYVCAHLAPVVDHFAMLEWDTVATPGLDTSAYAIEKGRLVVPDKPGFGLALDEERFQQAVTDNGFRLETQ